MSRPARMNPALPIWCQDISTIVLHDIHDFHSNRYRSHTSTFGVLAGRGDNGSHGHRAIDYAYVRWSQSWKQFNRVVRCCLDRLDLPSLHVDWWTGGQTPLRCLELHGCGATSHWNENTLEYARNPMYLGHQLRSKCEMIHRVTFTGKTNFSNWSYCRRPPSSSTIQYSDTA
ncbi:hypothetical protein PM082_015889 [Marasmius tenuissimus]|nr:hypothetical protein PM082_015889 [Marasmius tenuissimus]